MRLNRRTIVAGALAAGFAGPACAQTPFEGAWWGALEAGGARLRLKLEIEGQNHRPTAH